MGLPQGLVDQVVNKAGGVEKQKSLGGFAGNILGSGAKLVGDIGSAVLNPIDTAKNIYNLGSGIVQLAIPEEQGNEKLARAVGQFYADRYGGLDKAWNTLYNDPVGMAADISTVLGGGGALLKGVGSLSKASGLTRAGSVLSKAGRTIDPLSVVGKAGGVIGKGKSKLAGALASESENLLTRGMGNPQTLKKAKGVSPITMRELFSKYNTYDRTPEAFQAGAKQAQSMAKGLLEQAPTSIDTRRILSLFDEEIAKLQSGAKTSTKMANALDELVARKQMFLDGIQNENVSTPLMSDASKVYGIKSAFQGDVPPSSFGMPTQEVGKNLGTTKAYQTLLRGIEEQAPGIKNLGREQSALIKLEEMARASGARGAARQNINFSKLGSATAGGVVAGIPGAVVGYVGERIANSPQFLAGSSKAMELGSKALSKPIKIPTRVGRGANLVYQGARVGRMTNTNRYETPKHTQSQVLTPQNPKNVTYNPSIPQPVKKPVLTKQIKYKAPNVFNNKSSFGKTFKLKTGSFN